MSHITKSSKAFHETDVSFISDDTISATDTTSTISRYRRLAGIGVWFKWSSSNHFLLFTIVYITDTWCFSSILKNAKHEFATNTNIMHFLLVFILLGLPITYMYVAIGQYTQRGVIFIKDMCPIVHGTAYTALLNVFVHCIDVAISVSIIIIYLLSSFTSNMQWMICPKDVVEICWNSKTNCTKECLAYLIPSARLFFFYAHLEVGSHGSAADTISWVIKKFLPLASCWVLVIVCLGYTKVTYRKLITIIFCMATFLFGIVFTGCILTHGGLKFIADLIRMSWMQFLMSDAWLAAFYESFQILGIGRCLHIITGTFLAPKAHAGLLSISAAMLIYLVVLIMGSLAMSAYRILQTFSHSNDESMRGRWFFTQDEAVFTIIPQSFDFMSIPQFWSFTYFLSCLLIDMNCLMAHIIVLEKCIKDANEKLQRYRVYTTLVITTMVFFCCLIIYRNQNSYANFATVVLASEICEMINATIIIIAVFVLYGVQKFCDDIHFMSGAAPTKFWKFAWYLMPLLYSICTCFSAKAQMDHRLRTGYKPNIKVMLISMGIFLSPIILFAILKILQYMKKKNLVGLFRATEMYGPSDPEERYLRQVHNPRTEIKSERKNDTCAHRCFIENRAFRKALMEEQREVMDSDLTVIDDTRQVRRGGFDLDDNIV